MTMPDVPKALRVLFIGNSQCICGDLPSMVAAQAELGPRHAARITAEKALIGGKGLDYFWNAGDQAGTPRAAIAQGPWDYVVIQEKFWAKEPEFREYASRFDDLIRRHGSRTLLFATANVTATYTPGFTYPESFLALNNIQVAFARERGLKVAAAGLAWMKYLGPNPTEEQLLKLYAADKGHPGPRGSLIYACLLYATITGCDPRQLTPPAADIDAGPDAVITIDEVLRARQAAWDQYLEQLQHTPQGN